MSAMVNWVKLGKHNIILCFPSSNHLLVQSNVAGARGADQSQVHRQGADRQVRNRHVVLQPLPRRVRQGTEDVDLPGNWFSRKLFIFTFSSENYLKFGNYLIKLVGTRMVDNQSTPAHRPTICWGCWTDTQMVDAKLHKLLIFCSLIKCFDSVSYSTGPGNNICMWFDEV